MPTLRELLEATREDFMPMLVGAIESDSDPDWLGTCMFSDDFDVIIRSNFVLLPPKLLTQRLIDAATEEHKKVFQTEKAVVYVEKLGKWLDNYNKKEKADGEKEIEEQQEFIAMLTGSIEGDRDLDWLGGYILSENFDIAIRSAFVLLPTDVVLKKLAEIATDDQRKLLQTEKATAYVAKLSRWLDEFNKAEKAEEAAMVAAHLAAQQASAPAPADAPVAAAAPALEHAPAVAAPK